MRGIARRSDDHQGSGRVNYVQACMLGHFAEFLRSGSCDQAIGALFYSWVLCWEVLIPRDWKHGTNWDRSAMQIASVKCFVNTSLAKVFR